MDKKTTPKSIRMVDGVFENFQKLQNDTGLSANTLMSDFLTIYAEKQDGFSPESKETINQLETLLTGVRAIVSGQAQSLLAHKTALETETKTILDAKDKITKTLQCEIDLLRKKSSEADHVIKQITEENNHLRVELEALKEKANTEKELGEILQQIKSAIPPVNPTEEKPDRKKVKT